MQRICLTRCHFGQIELRGQYFVTFCVCEAEVWQRWWLRNTQDVFEKPSEVTSYLRMQLRRDFWYLVLAESSRKVNKIG